MSSPQTTPVPAARRRRRRLWMSMGVLAIGAIAVVLFYFEPQAAFFDDTVDEALPGLDVASAATPRPLNSIGASLQQATESGQPVVVSSGSFISGEHDTHGTALLVALPDGSLVVRFEDLDTSNGPDLRVVLSPEPASSSWQYEDRFHLGELKGNIGDQNYAIGEDIDLSRYRSVVIWCERFGVAFGAAPIDVTV